MKSNLFTTVKYGLLTMSVLLGSCTTDLYEEKPGSDPEIPTSGIPDDFDFSTVMSKQLTVNVMDEYEGKYYYTVEVLNANPIMDPEAKVLIGGKTNKNKPFNAKLIYPKVMDVLYIRQTDPYGLKKIWSFDVKTGDMVCDLKPAEAPSTKSGSQLRAGENFDSEDGVSFDSTGATAISAITQLADNGTYVIPKGTDLEMQKLTANNVKLYVEGSLTITNELVLTENSAIYVKPSGVIKGNNDGNGKLTCQTGSRIFNSGSIDLNKVGLEENKAGSDCVLFNIGEIVLKELGMDGSRIFNYCLLQVENRIDLEGAGSSIYLKKGAILCKHLFVDVTSNMYVYAKSVFIADQQVELSNKVTLTVYGEDGIVPDDYALFKTPKVDIGQEGGFYYYWGVEMAVGQTIGFTLNGVSEGQPTTQIDKSSCNNNTGNTPDKEDPDNDPVHPETNTASFTYLFEDNWPVFGDYDMNDLVMDVNIANTVNADGNAISVTITTTLRAVGATKNLYAYAQIEAEGANNLSVSLLDDKEAHVALGGEPGNILNTMGKSLLEPKVFVKKIELSGVKGRVDVENLNVYIVSGDPMKDKRGEIHLPGFSGTSKAAPTGKKGYKYDGTVEGANTDFDNMMWALRIPTSDFKSYPKESVKIFEAYPNFKKWTTNGGKDDEASEWYMNGLADKLF